MTKKERQSIITEILNKLKKDLRAPRVNLLKEPPRTPDNTTIREACKLLLDPVFMQDGKYYFYHAESDTIIGPFPTEKEARKTCPRKGPPYYGNKPIKPPKRRNPK